MKVVQLGHLLTIIHLEDTTCFHVPGIGNYWTSFRLHRRPPEDTGNKSIIVIPAQPQAMRHEKQIRRLRWLTNKLLAGTRPAYTDVLCNVNPRRDVSTFIRCNLNSIVRITHVLYVIRSFSLLDLISAGEIQAANHAWSYSGGVH